MTGVEIPDCTADYFECLARRRNILAGRPVPEKAAGPGASAPGPATVIPLPTRPAPAERTETMYDYRARLHRVVGPITLRLDVDLGFMIHYRVDVRLDLEQPKTADRARATGFVRDWLAQHEEFTVRIIDPPKGTGSWHGRWLAQVIGDDHQVLNDLLVKGGYTQRWAGQPA